MRTIRFSAAGESSRGTLTAGLAERWSFGRAATSAANCPLRCAARRRHVAARTRTGFLSQKAAFLGEVVGVLVLAPMKLRCCMPNKNDIRGSRGTKPQKLAKQKIMSDLSLGSIRRGLAYNYPIELSQYLPMLGVLLSYRAFTVSAEAWRATILSRCFKSSFPLSHPLKNLYKLPESIKNA